MKKYLKWGMLIVMLGIAVLGIWVVTNPKNAIETFVDMGGLKEGAEFPLVKGEEVDGKPVSLTEYKGKKFVVMIGRIDCEVCQKTYPLLEKLKTEYPDTKLILIGQGDKGKYAEVKKEHQFQFPIMSANTQIRKQLNFKIFPVFYLVNEQGTIEERLNGLDEDQLKGMLRKAGENA